MVALEGIEQLVTEAARAEAAGRLLREWRNGTASKDLQAWGNQVAAVLQAIVPADPGLAPPPVSAKVRPLRARA